MDTQIAPPPTDSERLRALAGRMREALSRDGSFKTRTSMEESHRASREFFKALDEVLAKVAPPKSAPPAPRQPFSAFIALPLTVRTGAADAAARGLRGVIGEGSKAQHHAIAAAVWNFMRVHTASVDGVAELGTAPASAEVLYHMAYSLELVPLSASVPHEMLGVLQRQYLAAHRAAAAAEAVR